MNRGEEQVYEFEGFRLDAGKRLLFKQDGEPAQLMPKAYEILLYLVERSGEVAEKDELMKSVWPDTAVEDNNLTQNISALRRVLGEKHRENRFIATIPGRGYKFVADVKNIPAEKPERVENTSPLPLKGENDQRAKNTYIYLFAVLAVVGILATAFFIFRNKITGADQPVESLAILPFKPITAENRDEALETGMADTLIMKLSGGERLTVRPLAAVRRFTSPEQDPAEAGRLLGVEAVLDGGVQIASGRVRVSAKLIRSKDGRQLWAGQFDEPIGDIFNVQDSISQRVADALRISLSNRAGKSFTANVEAYQLFARGKLHSSRLILPEVQKGISYFEQAIAIDPAYALAYAELSNAYRAMVLTNDAHPREIMPKAQAAALKAVQLDENLADAWTSLGSSEFWHTWDWQAAEDHFRRAIALDPSSSPAHIFYAHLLSNLGRHDEALAEIRRARELDPLSLLPNVIEGQILCLAGRDDDSLQTLRAAIALNPDFWLAHLFIARPYINKGMWAEAAASAARAKEITNGNSEATATIGFALGRSGRSREAREVLAELEGRETRTFVSAYALAQVYLGLGDRVRALDNLEKAFEQREALMVFLKVEPRWNALRSEPRFIALMDRMGF